MAQMKAKIFLLLKYHKVMMLSLQRFLSLKVNLVQPLPYYEESLIAKLDPLGESQFLSAQPCHKEDTTFPHESADLITEEGTSDDSTKDCSSGTSARKIPTEVTYVKFDSVSDSNTESQVDHGNLQSSEISNIEPSEPSPSPVRLRRSTRSTKGMSTNKIWLSYCFPYGECSG